MSVAAFALIALIVCAPQGAPATLAGLVVDAGTGVPVAGARVSVAGASGAVTAGRDGRFVWTAPPLLPAVLLVTFADGRVARPVHVEALPAAGPLIVRVEPAVHETVTVSGLAPGIDVAPGAATVRIGREDLAQRHPATLVQALEIVPGVHAIAEGQSAVPVVRGLGRGRTLILVDGARATSERRAGPNASFVDPATVASLGVARGPAGVTYGSDAFGGVIAVQSIALDRRARWHGRATTALGAGVPERGANLDVSRGYASGAVSAGVRARVFDDYQSPDGVVPNSAWRDRGARVAWEHDFDAARLVARWTSDAGRDLGRPRSDDAVMRVTSPVEDAHRLTVSWQAPEVGPLRAVRVDALAGGVRQQTDQDRLASTSSARPRSLESSVTSHRDVQLRAVAERGVFGARVTGGVDIQGRYGLRTRDTVTAFNLAGAELSSTATLSIDDADRTGAGLFADVAMPIASRLQASVGGRFDAVRSTNRGGFWGDRAVSHRALAGVAAVTAAPRDGLLLTAQVARGFRDPTLTDRFYRGPVGRGIVEGNPDLTPETSLQVDATMRITTGRVRAELAAYHYRVTDLIERYAVNQNLFRYRNRGDARFRGIEVSTAVLLPRGFAVEVTAEASRGRDGDDGTPLDDVAPASAAVIGRYAGARLGGYARLVARRAHDAAGPSEVATPGYTTADAGGSWRLTPRVTARLLARNLFDARHYASSGPRWVYAPGRHAVVSLDLSF